MSSFQINLALISKFGIIQWIVEHVFEQKKSEKKLCLSLPRQDLAAAVETIATNARFR